MKDLPSRNLIFVTGATGYIGGRLVPRLLTEGYRVRCLARDPRKLADRHWVGDPRVDIVAGDAADPDALRAALEGCSAAYYLIHSMMAVGPGYRARDREIAEGFARAARDAGVGRILYLGGLGETGAGLSEHLASRREVESALASTGVPVTVLRAAMIIGSGSASFEILRYLVERLPVMVTPRWVVTECQPISVEDTLHYLVACLATPETAGRALDIGGPQVLPYFRIMQIMATERALRPRLILPVPVLTPRLSALWIHLVTPVPARIARPLADGLRNRVVVRDDTAERLMPHVRLTVREAIARAGAPRPAETTWLDAGIVPGDPDWAGGTVFEDRRERAVAAPAEAVFRAICRVGGAQGWYSAAWLWKLRGAMDRLIGGPGLSRGRPHPDRVAYGDVLDFWRVVDLTPGSRLTLRAEMKLPGEAELEFEVRPTTPETCVLSQTARFKPRGLAGLVYWSAVSPFHSFVFSRMLGGIRKRAEVTGI